MVRINRILTGDEYITWLIDKEEIITQNFPYALLESIRNLIGYGDYWDYPLVELEHVVENDLDVVLVQFADGIVRWCQVDTDE